VINTVLEVVVNKLIVTR